MHSNRRLSDAEEAGGGDPSSFSFPDPAKEVARSLEIAMRQVEDMGLDPLLPRIGRGPETVIGFDTEFVAGETQNEVLSYQFYLIGEFGSYAHVHYPKGRARRDRARLLILLRQVFDEVVKRGIVREFPTRLVVVGFFLRVDLAAFIDMPTFKRELDSVGGSVASLRDVPSEVLASLDEVNETWVFRGQRYRLPIAFLDLNKHVPPKTSLRQVGEMLGVRKLDVPPPFDISRMDEWLTSDRKAFERYGLRDAEITAKHYLKLTAFAEQHVGVSRLPATASGLAGKLFEKTLREQGLDLDVEFGVETKSSSHWNVSTGRLQHRKERQLCPARMVHETLAIHSYHGGRNECFFFGPTPVGDYFDFDLAGAYTTGAVDLLPIDYGAAWATTNPEDFQGHVLGFARVTFEHPASVRFPVLPVRWGEYGVLFPRKGESWASAAEIGLAHRLGVTMQIHHGVIFPWRSDGPRLFEPFVREVRRLRSAFKPGSLDEQYAKLLGNSVYGKTGQGLKSKRVFDTRGLRHTELPPTRMSNPMIAAHITGFIRGVIGELLNGVPLHRLVISVATDGFLTDAPERELDLSGPLVRRFQELCQLVAPEKPALECKHRVQKVIAMRTRGQITGLAHGQHPIVLAKAGVALEGSSLSREEQNQKMVELFYARAPGQRVLQRVFTPLRDQWLHDLDVVSTQREIGLNLDFDMKRRPDQVGEGVIGDRPHLSFSTLPWDTVDDADATRAIFKGFLARRVLRSREDWADWNAYQQAHLARRGKRRETGKDGIRLRQGCPVDLLRRVFLRAYTQGQWGSDNALSYPQLAELLSGIGLPTSTSDVKNSRRSALVAECVPPCPAVSVVLERLKAAFPQMDLDRALIR